MSKISKLILATASGLLLTQISYADPVVELDNQNGTNCIKQLNESQDSFPIILYYEKNCPAAMPFLPTYDAVSKYSTQVGRSFYQFNFEGANRDVVEQCLGMAKTLALASPTVTVVFQIQDPETGEVFRSMPLHAWGGAKADPEDPQKPISITPQELEHIVKITDDDQLIKTKTAKKFSIHQRG